MNLNKKAYNLNVNSTLVRYIIVCISLTICGSFFSCIPIVRTVTGFRNPEVLSESRLVSIRNEIFGNDPTAIDLFYPKVNGKKEIINVMEKAFNGQFNIYDSLGYKLVFKNNNSCGSVQFKELYQSDSTNYQFKDVLIRNLNSQNIDSVFTVSESFNGKKYSIQDFSNIDYFVIYYWSRFMTKPKRAQEDYKWFMSNVNRLKGKFQVIRINCDPNTKWGLIENKKIKARFKSKGDKEYEVLFSKIPFN